MTKPEFWIGTSWKMNKTLAEAKKFTETLMVADQDPRIQRFVIPPFTLVRQVKQALQQTSIVVGAQNMHWQDEGAWTGEISPPMLTDCNLDIVELGHSERRAHFGETDQTVGLKTAAAVKHGLIPLVCVGETMDEREAGRARDVLEKQVRGALHDIAQSQKTATILFAYEPVWAIGVGGIPATCEYADARQAEIIALTRDILGSPAPCLYGGSVNAENCTDFIQCPHVDGLFIGRAAWDVHGYLDILTRCSAVI